MVLHTVYTPILPNFVSSAYSYLLHWTCMFHCHSVTLLEDLIDISNSACWKTWAHPLNLLSYRLFHLSYVHSVFSVQTRNLGVILDFYPHCQSMHTFYSSASHIGLPSRHIQNWLLLISTVPILVQSAIISCLEYFSGLQPRSAFGTLQVMLNTAARVTE